MVQEKFSEIFWKFIDIAYSNNNGGGIGVKELLEIFIKCQKGLMDKKVEFEHMSPYDFQLRSTFKEAVLDEDKIEIIVNWNHRKRVGAEFNFKDLDVLVDEKYVTFQDRKKFGKKVIIFLTK